MTGSNVQDGTRSGRGNDVVTTITASNNSSSSSSSGNNSSGSSSGTNAEISAMHDFIAGGVAGSASVIVGREFIIFQTDFEEIKMSYFPFSHLMFLVSSSTYL